MRGQEHELHAADEIGAGHHHEGRVAERDLGGVAGRSVADVVGGLGRQRNLVRPARVPGRRQHEQRQDHKAGDARRASQNLHSASARSAPTPTRRAIPPPRPCPSPCCARSPAPRAPTPTSQSHCAVQASEAPINTPRADQDRDHPLRGRHQAQGPTMYISEPTIMIGAEAVAHRHGAGERLQESPGEVLHGERQRELRHRNPDVVRQRLHEDAEALPQAHAEGEHQRGADQDGKRRPQDLQQGHCFYSPQRPRFECRVLQLISEIGTQTCVTRL